MERKSKEGNNEFSSIFKILVEWYHENKSALEIIHL